MNKIEILNGKKFATPVTDATTYKSLRNSEENLRNLSLARQGNKSAKSRLVQFNYSCLPNEDGTLKGATRLTHAVGMDVDFDPDAPDYEQKMADAPRHILEMKQKLGLLMLERSVNKGYHIVFRRHADMTQEENIKWASQLLSIEYDKGAKDCTRVFYATSASDTDLLYLDDALFDNSECVCTATTSLPQTKSKKQKETKAPEAEDVEAEEPLQTSLTAFDLCVKEAGLNPDNLDIWGQHNWHNNLLAVLSVGLPKLISKAQTLAVIQHKMPRYCQYADCKRLVDSFYSDYKTDKSYMSQKLREMNAKIQSGDTTSNTKSTQKSNSILLPPELPERLPRIIDLCIRNYDPRYRQMLAFACLPPLSAHASHFRAMNLSGRISGPQQYVVVVGGSGEGKGRATDLYNDMVSHTLLASDKKEMDTLRKNIELREQMKNSKECPPKYHPRLRTFENASKSSILDMQTNLGEGGMLLGQFSEVDGLFKNTQQSYSDISVILRKAWDGDTYNQYYLSESTCNTMIPLSISLLMAGTPNAVLERMFGDTENGLMQRCIPVSTPTATYSLRPPKQNLLNDDEKAERNALLESLYMKDLALGYSTKLLDLPLTNSAIESWIDELTVLYNEGSISEAEARLSHRCSEFMLRAAIPLVALYEKETQEIVDFAVWVGRTAFYNICTLFAQRVEQDMEKGKRLMNDLKNDARATSLPLLAELPPVFTTKDFEKLRKENGMNANCKSRLNDYVKKGYIKRIRRGVYIKILNPQSPSLHTSRM